MYFFQMKLCYSISISFLILSTLLLKFVGSFEMCSSENPIICYFKFLSNKNVIWKSKMFSWRYRRNMARWSSRNTNTQTEYMAFPINTIVIYYLLLAFFCANATNVQLESHLLFHSFPTSIGEKYFDSNVFDVNWTCL